MKTNDEMKDIGHGVSVELVYDEKELASIHYLHPPAPGRQAPGGYEKCYGNVPVKPYWPDGWEVISVEPLTLSPSLLCRACGSHGFIRDGKWVPA